VSFGEQLSAAHYKDLTAVSNQFLENFKVWDSFGVIFFLHQRVAHVERRALTVMGEVGGLELVYGAGIQCDGRRRWEKLRQMILTERNVQVLSQKLVDVNGFPEQLEDLVCSTSPSEVCLPEVVDSAARAHRARHARPGCDVGE
jgi:hypothetical protein